MPSPSLKFTENTHPFEYAEAFYPKKARDEQVRHVHTAHAVLPPAIRGAFKGHRSGDMLTREEWCAWKAFFHISDPNQAPSFGSKDWDELYTRFAHCSTSICITVLKM